MIAWHPETGEVILIDVKSWYGIKETSDNRSVRTQAQIEKNVCLLLYNADTRQLRFVEHDKDGKSD